MSTTHWGYRLIPSTTIKAWLRKTQKASQMLSAAPAGLAQCGYPLCRQRVALCVCPAVLALPPGSFPQREWRCRDGRVASCETV